MTNTDTRPVYLVNKSLKIFKALMLLKDEDEKEFNALRKRKKKLVKVSRKEWNKNCDYIVFLSKQEARKFVKDKIKEKIYEQFRKVEKAIYNRFKNQS